MRRVTRYEHHTGKLQNRLTLAVVSDLHNEEYEDIWPLIEGADALLVPGDISDRYRQRFDRGVAFLSEAARRMPTFYSLGNHEARQKEYAHLKSELEKTGAEILINRYVRWGETVIGGWYDPAVVREPQQLDGMEREEGVRILLCHKPEHYIERMRSRKLDLVVAGHAHGGQVRLLGQGLYAPGQGLFPKYTQGVVDGRMIISTGAGNPNHLPRWFNPCEVVLIHLD